MTRRQTTEREETVVLDLDLLKSTIYVRRNLDEDRVLQFVELYKSGADLPPIKVVKDSMEIEDGRHRREALSRLGRKRVVCTLVKPGDKIELTMRAFAANVGGALPPTRADVTFVMRRMIEDGVTREKIRKLFAPFYRPSHIRDLLKDAQSAIAKAKMKGAKIAIANGNTISEAASRFGVDLAALQEEVSGAKKRKRKSSVADIKTEITNRHRGNATKTVKIFRQLLDQFMDGETTENDVLNVLLHVKKSHVDAAKRIDEWLSRLEALKGSAKAKT